MTERVGQSEASAERRYLGALKLIDVMLTAAEGDAVPRGEAPKHSARLLARQVIGWRDPESTKRAWDEAVERAAKAFYEQDDPGGWDDLHYESKESRRCAAEHALIAAMEVLGVESTDA